MAGPFALVVLWVVRRGLSIKQEASSDGLDGIIVISYISTKHFPHFHKTVPAFPLNISCISTKQFPHFHKTVPAFPLNCSENLFIKIGSSYRNVPKHILVDAANCQEILHFPNHRSADDVELHPSFFRHIIADSSVACSRSSHLTLLEEDTFGNQTQ